jgi:hypothetical protein
LVSLVPSGSCTVRVHEQRLNTVPASFLFAVITGSAFHPFRNLWARSRKSEGIAPPDAMDARPPGGHQPVA